MSDAIIVTAKDAERIAALVDEQPGPTDAMVEMFRASGEVKFARAVDSESTTNPRVPGAGGGQPVHCARPESCSVCLGAKPRAVILSGGVTYLDGVPVGGGETAISMPQPKRRYGYGRRSR